MISTQADSSESAATAKLVTLGHNIQEPSPVQRDETPVGLEEEDTTLLKKETPIVAGCVGGNGKLYLGYTLGTDGKPVTQYLFVHPKRKKNNATEKIKREIFKGFYNYNCDIPVAIVKTELVPNQPQKKEFERESRILKELEVHENFIRYFTHETDSNFVYLATELCLCSVADLLDRELENKFCLNKKILSDLPEKEILRQATRGLQYLHENNFVHRNIKPNNFLIKKLDSSVKSVRRYVVKITDFRLTRKHDPENEPKLSGAAASEGWEAPESRDVSKDLSTKLDVFILGCFYHYVLTARTGNSKPKHPFGDNDTQRWHNLRDSNYSVYKEGHMFDLSDQNEDVATLMKSMLKFNEGERPTLQEVLRSPYYNPFKDYDIYNERFKKPGLCVIFNQQFFKNEKENRGGSDKDRDDLKLMFHDSGIDTEVYENLDSTDLKSEINNLTKRDWEDYGCLVVCLLSHGVENAIQCSDGKLVNINKIKYEFSLNSCPSLYGKPKIFIVEACQVPLSKNNMFFHMWDTASFFIGKWQSPSTVHWSEEEINANYKIKMKQDAMKYPPLMDFITIKAALAGFKAFRGVVLDKQDKVEVHHGSFFISALCKTLSEEMKEDNPRHLEDLLKMSVQDKINAFSRKTMLVGKHQAECKNQGEGQQQGCQCQTENLWQTMQWETCLSKNITFRNCAVKGKDVTPKPDSKKG